MEAAPVEESKIAQVVKVEESKIAQVIKDRATAIKEAKERAPRAKAGKLIVRNLVFDIKDKHLTAAFKKYGKIFAVNVPLNPTNNQNRGFAFVEFEDREAASNAITEMNGSKYKGRNMTVEFAVPKESYEKRLDAIVESTNMERKEAIKPMSIKNDTKTTAQVNKAEAEKKAKEEADAPPKTKTLQRKEKRERQKKEREDEERKENAKKERVAKTSEEKKSQGKRGQDTQNDADCTLFVRNIGWDTDEAEFRDFMESFGQIKYAVLCKTRGDLMTAVDEESGKAAAQKTNHKGTGFVRFSNIDEANALLELSKNLEDQLTEEHKKNEKKGRAKNQDKAILSATSLLKGELELGGRRLVVMPSVARTSVSDVV